MNEVEPVYFHNCPALGPDTRIPRAVRLDKENKVVLMYHHVCPFCSATGGDPEYAAGVTPNPDGSYSVDMSKAQIV